MRKWKEEKRIDQGSCLLFRMLKDSPNEDWVHLWNIDDPGSERIEFYNLRTRSMEDANVPWPVRWLLGRYHRKHIMMNRSLPDPRLFRQELGQFTEKLKWKPILQPREPPMVTVKRPTPVCNKEVAPDVTSFVEGFSEAMLIEFDNQRRHAVCERKSSPLSSPLTDWAKKILVEEKLTVVPHDKRAGLVVMKTADLTSVHIDILGTDCYSECDNPNWHCPELLMREYRKLSKLVANLENDPRLETELNKSLRLTNAKIVADLKTTVKSHKDPGHVVHRNLHTCPVAAFGGLSAYVDKAINKELKSMSHLLQSTEHFVDKLRALPLLPENAVMIRLDIKEFFPSGAPETLATLTAQLFSGRRKVVMKSVVKWLLVNQFVSSKLLPGRLWKVLRGTGMGSKHSGGIADASFYELVDKWFLKPSTQSGFAVIHYSRFKDDMFFVLASDARVNMLLSCFSARASSVYRIENAGISKHQVDMLAVKVTIKNRKIRTSPLIKEWARPLGHDSSHTSRVHSSWPVTYVKSLYRISTEVLDAKLAVENFISRLEWFGSPRWLVERVKATSPQDFPIFKNIVSAPRHWFVVSFHSRFSVKLWQKAIYKFVQSELNAPIARKVLGEGGVGLAWKSGSGRIIDLLRGASSSIR